MHIDTLNIRRVSLGVTLALAAATPALAQRIVLPAGSVILVSTTSALESNTARTGQSFNTTVEQAVGINEYTVIPAGSTIRGTITLARGATRQQSGVIDVVFDRLTLADGSTMAISGKLTSTDTAERRQIKSDPNAHVVLVGGRGGIGAAIAGAGSSRNENNILSALGSLLSEGRDVSVPAGTALAVELQTGITFRGGRRMAGTDASTIYTAPERVSAAQSALAREHYYRGAVNGQLDDATRRALFQWQADHQLSATGNLDGRTAQSLGINVSGGLAGGMLSGEQASSMRRDAQAIVARERADIGSSAVARLDRSRSYAQGDIDLWFSLSAFADNASLYEQVVRNGGNQDAAVLAGRALVASARRVDTAMQNARTSSAVQNGWANVRRNLQPIDSAQ